MSRKDKKIADDAVGDIMRKVAAMTIRAMTQNGSHKR